MANIAIELKYPKDSSHCLLRWPISRRPGVIVLRQHEFLHVSASDPNIAAIEDRQHHCIVEQVSEWPVGIISIPKMGY